MDRKWSPGAGAVGAGFFLSQRKLRSAGGSGTDAHKPRQFAVKLRSARIRAGGFCGEPGRSRRLLGDRCKFFSGGQHPRSISAADAFADAHGLVLLPRQRRGRICAAVRSLSHWRQRCPRCQHAGCLERASDERQGAAFDERTAASRRKSALRCRLSFAGRLLHADWQLFWSWHRQPRPGFHHQTADHDRWASQHKLLFPRAQHLQSIHPRCVQQRRPSFGPRCAHCWLGRQLSKRKLCRRQSARARRCLAGAQQLGQQLGRRRLFLAFLRRPDHRLRQCLSA